MTVDKSRGHESLDDQMGSSVSLAVAECAAADDAGRPIAFDAIPA